MGRVAKADSGVLSDEIARHHVAMSRVDCAMAVLRCAGVAAQEPGPIQKHR